MEIDVTFVVFIAPDCPKSKPGCDGRDIIPVEVHWIVGGPRILQPWGKEEIPPHQGGSSKPRCTTPPMLHLLYLLRIQGGQPPTACRYCNSTYLPLAFCMYENVHKTIYSKTKSSQDPFSFTYLVYMQFMCRFLV